MVARCLRSRRASTAGPALLLALTWLAFALRVLDLTRQSLWRDEVDALMFATRPLGQLLAMFRRPGENGPLFFLGLRPWLAAAGGSEFSLRFPSALAGALAVPILYGLTRRLAGRKPAAIAALLAATAPYLVWYGQEAKMYAALTALVPLSLWLVLEAARRGRWWRWVTAYIVTSLCFYTHVLAALVVPVQAAWLVILLAPRTPGAREVGDEGARRRWAAAAGYLAALVLPYLPMAWWQARLWLSPTFQTGHPFVPLLDIFKVLAAAFCWGVLPVTHAAILLPSMLALVAGIALWTAGSRRADARDAVAELGSRGEREQEAGLADAAPRWRAIALLTIWLLLPPVAIYGISLGMPIFTDRYLIWAMPAFLILVAMGAVALARAWRPLGVAVLAAVLALNLAGVAAQASAPIKSDFRAAAGYVLAHRRPADLLLYQIPYNRYVFTYYSSGRADPGDRTLRWLDGPYTNNGMTEAEVADQLARGTAGAEAIWLIASEVSLWDRRGLTEKWLAEHGTVTDRADFVRVSVTRYVLRGP